MLELSVSLNKVPRLWENMSLVWRFCDPRVPCLLSEWLLSHCYSTTFSFYIFLLVCLFLRHHGNSLFVGCSQVSPLLNNITLLSDFTCLGEVTACFWKSYPAKGLFLLWCKISVSLPFRLLFFIPLHDNSLICSPALFVSSDSGRHSGFSCGIISLHSIWF